MLIDMAKKGPLFGSKKASTTTDTLPPWKVLVVDDELMCIQSLNLPYPASNSTAAD